jgi:HAD superfamily hydrolase (TIGR01549 family)
MTRQLRFVFFDVGSTLLFANRERMLAPLFERGIRPPEQQLREMECRVKNEFDEVFEHGGKADHGFWDIFYSHLCEDLRLQDEPLRQQLIANTRTSANWNRIRPGTRETLERIAGKYTMGVISNADGRIADLLAGCGIADCFRTITDSGIVGQEKPHPVIFETALASLGASAQDSLYVGDVYSVDYCGATRAGMDAVLFDVCGAYRDKGLPRVESLEELDRMIGGGAC